MLVTPHAPPQQGRAGGNLKLHTSGSDYLRSFAPLMGRLLLKKRLLEYGDDAHNEIKTALIIDGGGMRGVYGGGVVSALEDMGLTNAFDYVIGVSAGAANSAYFLSGQANLATSMYYEELSGARFINTRRIHKVLDLDYFASIVRGLSGNKPLRSDRVQTARSRFYVGLTNARTGAAEYLHVNNPDEQIDIVSAICASAALPVAYHRNIVIHDTPYSDGTTACGIPFDYIVDTLGCDTVLLILNRPMIEKKQSVPWYDRLFTWLTPWLYTNTFRQAYFQRSCNYNRTLERIRSASLQTSGKLLVRIICPDDMPIGNLYTESPLLKAIATEAKQHALRVFQTAANSLSHPLAACSVDTRASSHTTLALKPPLSPQPARSVELLTHRR